MLVGVLVEVVANVMRDDAARMTESGVRSKLKELMETTNFDEDGDGNISQEELDGLLQNRKAALMIQGLGVDVVGLVDSRPDFPLGIYWLFYIWQCFFVALLRL